jgi:hypothetical protein
MIDRRLQFVAAHVGWMVASVLVLAALESFSYVLFYVVSLIGFFVVYELSVSAVVRSRWDRRLRLVAIAWILGFVATAGWQIAEIVSSVT